MVNVRISEKFSLYYFFQKYDENTYVIISDIDEIPNPINRLFYSK